MGAVSEHLQGMVERQVKEKGLIVWFDPEGTYRELVEGLSLPDTAVEVCGESLFELRYRIEPYLSASGDTPPRLVVYVPKSREETRDALVELTASGVVMEPSHKSHNLNTRLAVVAKQALRESLGKEQVEKVSRDVEAGRLSLADLDRMSGKEAGVVSLVFGSSYPQEVALKLLGGDRYDAEVASRDAVGELAALLGGEFGISLPEDSCETLRSALARHVLATELVGAVPEPLPQQLSSLKVAGGDAAGACASLAHEWRNRSDLCESYTGHADRVEQELALGGLKLPFEQLRGCETFAAVELALQSAIEERALEPGMGPEEHREVLEVIQSRLRSFWAKWPERYEDIGSRWRLLESALRLLGVAEGVENGLKSLPHDPEQTLRRYAGGDEPWHELDAHHRRLERRYQEFARSVEVDYPELDRLSHRARRWYVKAAEALSEHYLESLEAGGFKSLGLPAQREVFSRHVAPALERGKVAYLLVDALRYEMAQEMVRTLQGEHETTLSAAAATVPTVTQIGMSSLMPGAESGVKVVTASGGKLGLEVEGEVLSSRRDRVRHLQSWAEKRSKKLYETRLEGLYSPDKKLRSGVEGADLVFATSQELDQQGELGSFTARRFMDETLRLLPKAIRTLAGLGCETIVVASDHGFLFAEELDDGMKIDLPGGHTKERHRRVWVGTGGSDEDSFLRVPLAKLGLGELEMAVPRGLGAFRVPGGSEAYFHGGMSPQEVAVPVLTCVPRLGEPRYASDVQWRLVLGSRRITTRAVMVRVGGHVQSLFEAALPRVTVEVRAGGSTISEVVDAGYGFSEAARDIEMSLEGQELKENPVTLLIEPEKSPDARTASVHLIDSSTGRELQQVANVELEISV